MSGFGGDGGDGDSGRVSGRRGGCGGGGGGAARCGRAASCGRPSCARAGAAMAGGAFSVSCCVIEPSSARFRIFIRRGGGGVGGGGGGGGSDERRWWRRGDLGGRHRGSLRAARPPSGGRGERGGRCRGGQIVDLVAGGVTMFRGVARRRRGHRGAATRTDGGGAAVRWGFTGKCDVDGGANGGARSGSRFFTGICRCGRRRRGGDSHSLWLEKMLQHVAAS